MYFMDIDDFKKRRRNLLKKSSSTLLISKSDKNYICTKKNYKCQQQQHAFSNARMYTTNNTYVI